MRYLLALALVFICAGTSFALRPAEVSAAPARDLDAEALRAVSAGCADAAGLFESKVQGGVVIARCVPYLGIGPKVERRVK